MRIENSVTRIAVRHHEDCRVMPNSYPELPNFQFAPYKHCKFFFLPTLHSTIVCKGECALFYQFYAEINTFSIMKCSVRPLSTKSWRRARGRLTPPWYKMEISRTGENRGKPCRIRICKKKESESRYKYKITAAKLSKPQGLGHGQRRRQIIMMQ